MAIERMSRSASDNVYLHKDFHVALNNGLVYLHNNYGYDAVVQYLADFSRTYHAPLRDSLISNGLVALKEYFEDIYQKEQSRADVTMDDDELTIRIDKCPGIEHIKKNGQQIYDHYVETTSTVYRAICEETPYEFKLDEYDDETGRAIMRFTRRRI